MEPLDKQLANDIIQKLESAEPPTSPECCIYWVPYEIRRLNEEAYTPQFVSIGPFYHGNSSLKTMEKLKVRYFKKFVENAALSVKHLVSHIRVREKDVRRCYAEPSRLSSDEYVKMILVDASFIIVFFLIRQLQDWRHYHELTVFLPRLIGDMWLLENQLPFFIIEELYNLAFASSSNYPSFTQLTFKFFEGYNTQKMFPNLKVMHFVDLLRTFFLPQSYMLTQRSEDLGVEHLYTASELDEAGVKFKVGSSERLFDLKFTNGVLEIPCIKLNNQTESLFRNLMALEQCCYQSNAYVTDYIRILDFLIDTTKDVDLLVRKRILINHLGDSNAVTTLVNNLGERVLYLNMNSDYCRLCKDLNSFYEDHRHSLHRWKATLRRDYFSTPWRIASTKAVLILLVLTFTQTICSIISLL